MAIKRAIIPDLFSNLFLASKNIRRFYQIGKIEAIDERYVRILMIFFLVKMI